LNSYDSKDSDSIYIYYHYFCTDRTVKIFDNALNNIVESGLYDHTDTIFVNVVGDNCVKHICKLISKYRASKKIVFVSYRSDSLKSILDSYTHDQISQNPRLLIGRNGMEGDTLELLHTNTINYTKTANILYIHSKGATNEGGFCNWNSREEWCKNLMNGTVNNWSECLDNLADKPHVGPNYHGKYQANSIPHYSGNFWWTTSDHIKKMIPYNTFCSDGFLINKILNKIDHCPGYENYLPFLASPFYLAEYWITHA